MHERPPEISGKCNALGRGESCLSLKKAVSMLAMPRSTMVEPSLRAISVSCPLLISDECASALVGVSVVKWMVSPLGGSKPMTVS
jgi:hypothetical protein